MLIQCSPLEWVETHFFFAHMTGKTKIQLLTELIETSLEPTEFEVVLVEFQKAGGTWTLRVFIDHPEGVTLPHCQEVSHILNEMLEEKDPIQSEFNLEVSSPGVDRPLVKLSDYQRFLNERVFIKTHQPIDGSRKFTGELLACSEEAIEVKSESSGVTSRIPLDLIAKATLKPILNFS